MGPLNSGVLLLPVKTISDCYSFYELADNVTKFLFSLQSKKKVTNFYLLFQPFGGHSPIIITHVILDLYSL